MSDYTPTTEEVRDGWVRIINEDGSPSMLRISPEDFDRWLAEVKAQEREACVNHVKFLYCSHSMEHKPYRETVDEIVELLTGKENGSEVFDRWLAEVKAQEAKAERERIMKLVQKQLEADPYNSVLRALEAGISQMPVKGETE